MYSVYIIGWECCGTITDLFFFFFLEGGSLRKNLRLMSELSSSEIYHVPARHVLARFIQLGFTEIHERSWQPSAARYIRSVETCGSDVINKWFIGAR